MNARNYHWHKLEEGELRRIKHEEEGEERRKRERREGKEEEDGRGLVAYSSC